MADINGSSTMASNLASARDFTLEILIPTYKRPAAALRAVESCRRCDDTRLAIFCHSNGFEPQLEVLRVISPNVFYDCFPENRGVHANFLKVLSSKRAKFVMLLSDEDRVDPHLVSVLLGYLDNECRSDVVTCSVLNTDGTFYYDAGVYKSKWASSNDNLMTDPFGPSYVSGWIYRTEALSDDILRNHFRPSTGNAYPHLTLKNALLARGLNVFRQPIVHKGDAIKTGGDGYSHRLSQPAATCDDNNLDLNPEVYGARARARQYFYLQMHLSHMTSTIPKIVYIVVAISLLLDHFFAIVNSRSVVRYLLSVSFHKETLKAREEAIRNNEFHADFFSDLFPKLLDDRWMRFKTASLKLLRVLLRLIRFGYRRTCF